VAVRSSATAEDLPDVSFALAEAVPAIVSGMVGAFLQTEEANNLKRFTMEKAEIPYETRQEVLASSREKESMSLRVVFVALFHPHGLAQCRHRPHL